MHLLSLTSVTDFLAQDPQPVLVNPRHIVSVTPYPMKFVESGAKLALTRGDDVIVTSSVEQITSEMKGL